MEKEKKKRTLLEWDKERLPSFYQYKVSKEAQNPYKMKKRD